MKISAVGITDLKVLEELSVQDNGCDWRKAMDIAARNGHLDVVMWLHENRTEGCSDWAVDYAAKYGHLEVVRWLYQNGYRGYRNWAVDLARMNGHHDIVEYLNSKE